MIGSPAGAANPTRVRAPTRATAFILLVIVVCRQELPEIELERDSMNQKAVRTTDEDKWAAKGC